MLYKKQFEKIKKNVLKKDKQFLTEIEELKKKQAENTIKQFQDSNAKLHDEIKSLTTINNNLDKKSNNHKDDTSDKWVDYDNFPADESDKAVEEKVSSEVRTQGKKKTLKKKRFIFKCKSCDFKNQNCEELEKHLPIHRKIPNKRVESNEQRLECSLCDYTTTTESVMEKHMKVAMGHQKKNAKSTSQPPMCS